MVYYKGIVDAFLGQVDLVLENYVYDGYQAMADYLAAPLGVAIVLFFVCYGIGLTKGFLEGSFQNLIHSIFKIGLIYFVGMNWGNFSEYVCTIFYVAAGQIGEVLINASPINFPGEGVKNINDALQSVLSQTWEISAKLFMNGGLTNTGPWISGFILGSVGLLLIGLALLEIVIAKCMLSILFVLAPLFIVFTLFKHTHNFFNRWLGSCVGYAMLMIFICASLGIVLELDYWIVQDVSQLDPSSAQFIDVGVAILVTWVCIGILRRITGLALLIGDCVTTVDGAALISDFARMASGALALTRQSPNKFSEEQEKSSGNSGHFKNHTDKKYISHIMKRLRNGEQ